MWGEIVEKITESMTIEEVLEKYPTTVKVFMEMKIPCLVCGEPSWDTVKETAERYGVELPLLLKRLNEEVK